MMIEAPDYWMNETTGVLRPAVESYLGLLPMTPADIAALRAYLRQWINAPDWVDVDDLRGRISDLTSREAIDRWLRDAMEAGIDPL